MKTVKLPLTLRCFCTPADLEKISQRMRKTWAHSAAGDCLMCGVSAGDDAVIEFVIDQERMFKECGPPESGVG